MPHTAIVLLWLSWGTAAAEVVGAKVAERGNGGAMMMISSLVLAAAAD
jgi:hypothetical protein